MKKYKKIKNNFLFLFFMSKWKCKFKINFYFLKNKIVVKNIIKILIIIFKKNI